MNRAAWRVSFKLSGMAVCALLVMGIGSPAWGTALVLKDGRVLEGELGLASSLAEQPSLRSSDGNGPLQLIAFIDDDLRRTFVSKRQIQAVREGTSGGVTEIFRIRQRVARGGHTVKSIGPILRITPFDEFGRRIFTMSTMRGPVDIIQGITELSPQVARLEGITHVWDMRMATSSIARDELRKILLKQIDQKNLEDRKKIARFYVQADRYEEALAEMQSILRDFPHDEDVSKQLAPSIRELRQLASRRLLKELRLRRDAGQDALVLAKLKAFPSEDVAGEILQEVRELLGQYEQSAARRAKIVEELDSLLARTEDTRRRDRIAPIVKEIAEQLNLTTLGRMAAFEQNVDNPGLQPAEKLSLAISGWLLGSNAATAELPVSLSGYTFRGLIRQYLDEPVKVDRTKVAAEFGSEEAATPEMAARIIENMKPPLALPAGKVDQPGYYELEVTGLEKEPPVRYLVQLPPEYDPYRRYPTIVTLHGAGTTASQQVDWWAGVRTKEGWRAGQASRHGYIVVAPEWLTEHQTKYQYSAREHAAVLNCFRDACRHFSIDTDRVFLSGHSIGGDAAWDMGLAHPDLWAGVIPIAAQADRYVALYWQNARTLPLYVVLGELDAGKMNFDARDLDRYFIHGYNCTVVEYQGRGHESFSDEIQRLFDWMGRLRRDFFPTSFECRSMRPWDNFFWWVELGDFPPGSMIDPAAWPPPRGTQAAAVKASITANNNITVRAGANRVTVWISPQMVNFQQRVQILVNGQRINSGEAYIKPNLIELLEDVRTRADRQHPFWAKACRP